MRHAGDVAGAPFVSSADAGVTPTSMRVRRSPRRWSHLGSMRAQPIVARQRVGQGATAIRECVASYSGRRLGSRP
jgi:hypothetical protein